MHLCVSPSRDCRAGLLHQEDAQDSTSETRACAEPKCISFTGRCRSWQCYPPLILASQSASRIVSFAGIGSERHFESDVPEMFRDLREARDKTQIELADDAGMKQSAISRFESSRDAKWKLETLLKLAEALDAQLVISVVRAEDVIARYEREEAGGGPPRSSVLEVKPSRQEQRNDENAAAEAANPKRDQSQWTPQPEKASAQSRADRGARPT